jgi:integration host factor subunit alpha
MTKADIVERVYERVVFPKRESYEIVESAFELIREELRQGGKVKIAGFGNFSVREKKSRKGRNPQTGEEIEIPARKVLTFKPSNILRDALNKGS